MRVFLVFVGIIFFFDNYAQQVHTDYGEISGYKNGEIYVFTGIPYAKPPIGELRWKAPEEPEKWSNILKTTEFAPSCPQKSFSQGDTSSVITGNEDCLYLNVWSPDLNDNLPVMIFIHGGGNQQGSTYSETLNTNMFDGKNLAERGRVVVVTIQYRLGALGFLAHPGLEEESTFGKSGNYAVLDQILALKWVKNNIKNFGGDAGNVMVFGESAGAVNTGNLLCTKLASGLFNRACLQSGVPVLDPYYDAKNKGVQFANQFITSGTDKQKIDYLRTLDASKLISMNESPLQNGVVNSEWGPVMDGHVFEKSPYQSVQSQEFNKMPVIIGSNENEMSYSSPKIVTPSMVEALISAYIPSIYREEARQIYPPGIDNTSARKSYVDFLTDMQFTSPAKRTAECLAANQIQPVYRYFFTHKHSIQQLQTYGSYHGMELFYVFNTWENTTLGGPIFLSQADKNVADAMLHYWVNFAYSGNPNGNNLETWPEYGQNKDCYININGEPDGTQCGLKTIESDFWYKVKNISTCIDPSSNREILISTKPFLFPNPAKDYLEIPAIFIDDQFNISIYNSLGIRLISSKEPNLNISKLKAGTYFVTIHSGNKILKTKFLKVE